MIIRGKERERKGREKIGGGSFLKKAPSPEPPPAKTLTGGEAARKEFVPMQEYALEGIELGLHRARCFTVYGANAAFFQLFCWRSPD